MLYVEDLYPYHITNKCMGDGFGSQYQHLISYLLYVFKYDLKFIYSPITKIEHNYNNDPDFIEKIENLMNIRPYFMNINDKKIEEEKIKITDIYSLMKNDEFNVKYLIDNDNDFFITEESLGKLRTMFWANKNKDSIFNNYKEKTNVAVHIRRPNNHDKDINDKNIW